jgi:hypothetical protein
MQSRSSRSLPEPVCGIASKRSLWHGLSNSVSCKTKPATSPSGTSRNFSAMQNSVAIGGMADIEQASPRSIWLKLPTVPVIAMLLATACQTPSFAETLVSRVYTYKPPNMQQLRCLAECYSYSDSGKQQVRRQEWYCPNGYGNRHCWGSCDHEKVQQGPCSDERN